MPRIRGDVNGVLNGLIREGVITGFETNFDGISALGILHIAVAAQAETDPRKPGYDPSEGHGDPQPGDQSARGDHTQRDGVRP